MEPHCSQWMATVLSLSRALVDSVTGVVVDKTAWWVIAPNSSRLELVIEPVGLSVETSCWQIFVANSSCQRIASWLAAAGWEPDLLESMRSTGVTSGWALWTLAI